MEYNRIVAVTGMPGLYEVVSSKSDGAIVRSLEDKSTKFVSSRIHNLSHLESIEVYTIRENVSLSDIFSSIKNSGQSLPDLKDDKSIKAWFQKVYPDLDFDRVYTSDMKKMVKWYEVLEQNNIDYTVKEAPEEEAEPVAQQPEVATVTKEKKTTKKAAEKATEAVAEKPAVTKKAAKKTAEAADEKPAAKKATAKKATPKKEEATKEKPKKTAKKK
jgi:hypothetical protein